MPSTRPKLTVRIDEDLYKKMLEAMEQTGILEKNTFIKNAILYYVTSLMTDDSTKTLITKDASNDLQRKLLPLSKDMKESDRVTQIMLNVIWKKLNCGADNLNTIELERLVREAVNEIDDNNGMKVTNIISSASSAKEIVDESVSNIHQKEVEEISRQQNQNLRNSENRRTENISNPNPVQHKTEEQKIEKKPEPEKHKSEDLFSSGWGKDLFADS